MQILRIKGCGVVSLSVRTDVDLGFLDHSRYVFFHIAPHLSSRGRVNPTEEPNTAPKNLVASGIEPGNSETADRNSDHLITEAFGAVNKLRNRWFP
jgi:hypothetical protein